MRSRSSCPPLVHVTQKVLFSQKLHAWELSAKQTMRTEIKLTRQTPSVWWLHPFNVTYYKKVCTVVTD